jgi:hypothetical protein
MPLLEAEGNEAQQRAKDVKPGDFSDDSKK